MSDIKTPEEWTRADNQAKVEDDKKPVAISHKAMSGLGNLVTAHMLYLYASSVIRKESPELVDDLQKESVRILDKQGEYSLDDLKFKLIEALQIVITNISELYLTAKSAVEEEKEQEETPMPVVDCDEIKEEG